MKKKCTACCSCGMPLVKPEDHALGRVESELCLYCAHPDGTPKTYDEVLTGMSDYFVQSQGIQVKAARDMAKQTMDKLPYWQQRKQ
jgi:hypothetical protein